MADAWSAVEQLAIKHWAAVVWKAADEQTQEASVLEKTK